MSTPSLDDLVHFALDATWHAGRVTLGYFQTGVAVERKADSTPLTIADREAERTLREWTARYWPDHGIVGEEFGASKGSSPYTWVFDPIDGTKAFVAGVPLYANLVACSMAIVQCSASFVFRARRDGLGGARSRLLLERAARPGFRRE
jgi:fructose-1,6-bisphosphatase/inositol monophosphatase family enzyme